MLVHTGLSAFLRQHLLTRLPSGLTNSRALGGRNLLERRVFYAPSCREHGRNTAQKRDRRFQLHVIFLCRRHIRGTRTFFRCAGILQVSLQRGFAFGNACRSFEAGGQVRGNGVVRVDAARLDRPSRGGIISCGC